MDELDKLESKLSKPYIFFIGDRVVVTNKNDAFYGKEGTVINSDHLILQDNRYLVDFGTGVDDAERTKVRTFFEKELESVNKRR